jgi:aminoglycoside/choline kinase family phosphotransferase
VAVQPERPAGARHPGRPLIGRRLTHHRRAELDSVRFCPVKARSPWTWASPPYENDDADRAIGWRRLRVAEDIDENRAFIGFGRTFRDGGLSVPEIYCTARDDGSYLLEDLGDETLLERIITAGGFNADIISLYGKAVDSLLKFQVDTVKKIDFNLCYQFNEFGNENIDYDINYFTERFLKVFYRGKIDAEKLNKDLNFMKQKILELPRDYFLYRDFQSRNIMLKGNDLYFIDFQSGRKGALLYDLASLLYDAKAEVPQNVREELVDYYLNEAGKNVTIEKEKYKMYFWYFAMVRILQALGAYGYVGIVKGRSKFLESIPYALNNINFILSNRVESVELHYLKKIFLELLNENNINKTENIT